MKKIKLKNYQVQITLPNFGETYIDVRANNSTQAKSKAFKKLKKSDFDIQIMKD